MQLRQGWWNAHRQMQLMQMRKRKCKEFRLQMNCKPRIALFMKLFLSFWGTSTYFRNKLTETIQPHNQSVPQPVLFSLTTHFVLADGREDCNGINMASKIGTTGFPVGSFVSPTRKATCLFQKHYLWFGLHAAAPSQKQSRCHVHIFPLSLSSRQKTHWLHSLIASTRRQYGFSILLLITLLAPHVVKP